MNPNITSTIYLQHIKNTSVLTIQANLAQLLSVVVDSLDFILMKTALRLLNISMNIWIDY